MKIKSIRYIIKTIVGVTFLLSVSFSLIGCSANSHLQEEATTEKHIKKEEEPKEQNSVEEEQKNVKEATESELTGQPLIFKITTEELEEKDIPDYVLNRKVKHYTGNKDVGSKIFTEAEGMTSILNGEIRDQPVCMDENQAVVKAKEWIDAAFVEFDISLLDNQEPLIMNMRKTELSDEPKEVITGYRIEYENTYDGYKIQGEGITVMLDDAGISYGNIIWNEYEKMNSTENNVITSKVDFEQSQILLVNAMTKKSEELGLDDNNEDARTVENVDLVFYGDRETEYVPTWCYEMVDGRTYYVNCIDGQVSYM